MAMMPFPLIQTERMLLIRSTVSQSKTLDRGLPSVVFGAKPLGCITSVAQLRRQMVMSSLIQQLSVLLSRA
jgi:hypothetical protein